MSKTLAFKGKIDVELTIPDGWMILAIRTPKQGEYYLNFNDSIDDLCVCMNEDLLGSQKRIILEKVRWVPAEKNQDYYFVNGDGEVKCTNYTGAPYDARAITFGNCFKTKEQAEAAARVIKKALEKFHMENI